MIVGEITSLSPEYNDNGAVVFRVSGYDRLYRLGFGRKTRSFRHVKDSDIAAQIAQDWRLTPRVEATDVTHEYVLQNNQTDREFLAERARRLRYEVRVEDRSLYFQKAREDARKITTLTYGETLIDFFPRLSTLNQTSQVEVRGWSVKDKEPIVGEAGSGDTISTMGGQKTGAALSAEIAGDSKRTLSGGSEATRDEAEARARAGLNQSVTEFVTGEGRCIGNPEIKAGQVVELKGLGERFSGLYYVVSCTHTIGSRGYHALFSVRRTAA
jgi:phage protein D